MAVLLGMGLSSVGALKVLTSADAHHGYGYEDACGRLDRDFFKTIDGNPLNVCIEQSGRIEARFDTDTDSSLPFADLALRYPDLMPDQDDYTSSTPVTQDAPTSGSVANQVVQVTNWRSIIVRETETGGSETPVADVRQTTEYVQGQNRFRTTWRVKNITPAPLQLRASAYGLFDMAGDGEATGSLREGPPRRLFGDNPVDLVSGGIEETGTPWSHYQYGDLFSRRSDFRRNLFGPAGLDDTVGPPTGLPAMAAQWDDHNSDGTALAPDATATYRMEWLLTQSPTLKATPYFARARPGETATAQIAYFDQRGFANKLVRYEITGSSPRTGEVRTDGAGRAPVSWTVGALNAEGRIDDGVFAYVDLDEDGSRDPGERTAQAYRFSGRPEAEKPPPPREDPPPPAQDAPPTGGDQPAGPTTVVQPPAPTVTTATPATPVGFGQLSESVNSSIAAIVARFNGLSATDFLRRKFVAHRFVFLVDGTVRFTWRVAKRDLRRSRTRRRGGARSSAAAKTVVIARGSLAGKAGQAADVKVKLTSAGRKLLKRTKKVRVTLSADFVGGAATKAKPAVSRSRFTIRKAKRSK